MRVLGAENYGVFPKAVVLCLIPLKVSALPGASEVMINAGSQEALPAFTKRTMEPNGGFDGATPHELNSLESL
jgi:hypothetical protein